MKFNQTKAIDISSFDPEIPFIEVSKKSETNSENDYTAMKELASALGADDAYFTFPNYSPENGMSEEVIATFRKNYSFQDASMATGNDGMSLLSTFQGGMCYGISLLEILTHNGIISVSDIQEGAETLHDILQFDSKVNDAIFYYSATQRYMKQRLGIRYYYCNSSYEKQYNDLINYSEKAMNEGKYFLITLMMNDGGHAIVGMGSIDGHWTFDDRTYDKCVLTLDSNSLKDVEAEVKEESGFNPKSCIYLNTETHDFYIPGYDVGTHNESLDIGFISDDESFMNYKGLINPYNAENYDVNVMSVNFQYGKKNNGCSFILNGENGSKEYHVLRDEHFDITENRFSTNNLSTIIDTYYTDYNNETFKFKYAASKQGTTYIAILTEDFSEKVACNVSFETEILHDKIIINKENGGFGVEVLLPELTSDENPYMLYAFDGYSDSDVSIEWLNDGVLLRTNGYTEVTQSFTGLIEDTDGAMVFYNNGIDLSLKDEEHYEMFKIYCNSDIMFRYNKDSNKIDLYIDDNNDDIFDVKIEKGDVNCDRKIDASDASLILEAYAELSTGTPKSFVLNSDLADYDDDGIVDASDASMVLEEYARLSTT